MKMDFRKNHTLLRVYRFPKGTKWTTISKCKKRCKTYFLKLVQSVGMLSCYCLAALMKMGGWNRERAVPSSSNQRTAPDHSTAATHLTLSRQIQYIPNPMYFKTNVFQFQYISLNSPCQGKSNIFLIQYI